MDERWIPTKAGNSPSGNLPQNDQRVDWIAPSGEVIRGGRYDGGMWILPGGQMYVYYQPPFWRLAERSATTTN